MTLGKILLAGSLVSLLLIAGLGWLAVQSVSLVAGGVRTGIEIVRPYVEESLPVGLSRDALERQLDAAAEAARNGRLDLGAARDTLWWLPGALLDGELDAAETATLASKLERIVTLTPDRDAPTPAPSTPTET